MAATIGFWILAICAAVTAVCVVASRNPVRSAVSLIAHMLILALLFLQLSAEFVAAVQVVVYAGAIMVLFLFTIMLLNVGAAARKRRKGAGFIVALLISLTLAVTVLGGAVWRNGLMKRPVAKENPRYGGTAQAIGFSLYDPELPWLFAFELTSVVLLTAAVGAVVLAERRR